MNTVKLNTSEIFSQSEETKQSTNVALTMGALSIELLFVVSSILSVLHYFLS